MKKELYIFIISFLFASCASTYHQEKQKDPHITVKTTKMYNGTIIRKTTYRNGLKIIEEDHNLKSNINFRKFYLHGSSQYTYTESDENHDGFFETIRIFQDLDDFEVFIRNKDGIIKPLSTDEYNVLQKKAKALTGRLLEAMKNVKMHKCALRIDKSDTKTIKEKGISDESTSLDQNSALRKSGK